MSNRIRFAVLGPVTAQDQRGRPVALKGPKHRAVLGRLLVARGRVVPVTALVDDLWVSPPDGAVAAVRTFVAALRRAIEPDRPARAPATVLVTAGAGYAIRADSDQVDAWRFEKSLTRAGTAEPGPALALLDEALAWWRGPAYADFPDVAWPRADRARLAELRLQAVEHRAGALLGLGRPAEAVPDLDAHVTAYPWREEGWRLLALALYRSGRQGDALSVLRRARDLLDSRLGVEPGPALRTLETDILRQEPHLTKSPAEGVWTRAAAAYDRVLSTGSRARLESAVGLLRNLAVTGPDGLEVAREQRSAAVAAAEELGDPDLTARVIGAYDVPAIWPRSDDPGQAAAIVAAAERTLAALPAAGHRPARARLLATIALESRGTHDTRPRDCARQAEAIARELDDPALLAFALNAAFMQSCHHTGGAAHRDAIGAELVTMANTHGLATVEVLGHLIRMQSACATATFDVADRHARAADDLADRHELGLVGVFTQWYRALRADVASNVPAAEAEAGYRAASARLDQAGMPGMREGLLPLALLGLRLRRDPLAVPLAIPLADPLAIPLADPLAADAGWGPYEPWVRPLLAPGRAVLAEVPDPPADLLAEALWCLFAQAAVAAGDTTAMVRARTALAPAAGEWAGAASGLLTVGPVAGYLSALSSLGKPHDVVALRARYQT
ncbi:AfsR/SARP family transcriptional regulator [Actinoplanes derwentensis]|uniref:DNA-binding transcriptional activator of the SARP family n=2 Tax=Actinoplanes derwentensis TaxID=113562 RepID=A0A1H2B880_9ACTN|nr:BTAD domain-containing putative transcriptional regulator [Actinoplanes derwentensis]GID86449.1 SARP family transcriptional regulator [Actinoplanes derwentensis]SDT54403.1 DNA-binding transcriptional activator of the SARP family [Actinoplanes derwentensis]